jgi:hypothetical protein
MRRAFQIAFALAVLGFTVSGPAAALEVTCIEASRYRHLYQLFGGDPKQFAAYLDLDPAQLPRPEHCRAVLLSGKVEPRSGNDLDQLLSVINANQGWLAVVQLSSGGGIIQTGYRLGFVTRMFWLKTHTATTFNRNLNYTPDFFVPPAAGGPAEGEEQPDAERIQNWRRYLTTQKGLSPHPLSGTGCASACGLIHTAGIDRAGEVRVHRARMGGGQDSFINLKKTMSETDRAMLRLELEQIAFYRQMDPGSDFVRQYQDTPAQTVTPVDVARFPRYVADYLTGRCKVNGDQLQELDRQIVNTISEIRSPLFGYWISTERLGRALRELRNLRADAERCIAAAHERERHSHFAKLCPNGCDRKTLIGMVEESVRALAKQAQ